MDFPEKWMERIFARLQGLYGAQFTSKFSRMDKGVDVGMLNAKATWANELGNFSDKPEAIAYALDHLPSDHAPNALEFRDVCRRAPKKEAPVLTHKLTKEDHERAASAAEAAIRGMKAKVRDGIDRHWATHPVSAAQLRFIFEASMKDQRFKACIDEMVEQGICTAEGVLLKVYRDRSFVKA